ncbi:mRNA turnover and ribosome assembly protein [Dipsacomyces acuminosporus]|nr:mRNA turnover and ribosome assembly protein [Dipsacomyces acuminosporus]
MPRAKRAQVVALTKTKSKGREGRREVMDKVREAAESYDYVWVFSVENMRNSYLKDVRRKFGTSRFFFGSNRVMAKALGNTEEEEIKDGMHRISECLTGEVGLLFTNNDVDYVKKAFDEFEADDYARSGTIATYKVTVPAGEVLRGYVKEPFPNNMEPQLRELGMPTLLKQGKIIIDSEYVICDVGDKLTPQQAQLLKHFWEKMAIFKIRLLAYLHNGDFTNLDLPKKTGSSDDGDEDSDEDME